ncbi:MAG TPA: hypothetical protein VG889_16055 [Rhizomicrobium sp.]|nr:hypothetical protein [Rhizomicrobium sp.]
MRLAIVLLLLSAGAAHAGDGFEAVRCGGDVRGALIGRTMSNEAVAGIEARHAALRLKNLGGDEVSDTINSTSWRICGKEYVVTTDGRDKMRDVLAFPEHSKATPEFSAGECDANGRTIAGAIVGVLDTDKTHVKAAWTTDEKTGKFSALAVAGLSCPKASIITADGGP